MMEYNPRKSALLLREEKLLRKILMSGLIVCFLIGILVFFFKFLLVDVLSPIFRPAVLFLFNRVPGDSAHYRLYFIHRFHRGTNQYQDQFSITIINKYIIRRVP